MATRVISYKPTGAIMIYKKEKTSEISFPLGGIGAGCIGLAGNGKLIDWEIYNGPNKNSLSGYTHFSIAANGSCRLLQGDCFAPYTGKYRKGDDGKLHGFGFGVEGEYLAGLPHYRNHIFKGTYPVAELEFSGEEENFPIAAKLTAWSPFIPGMSRACSMPCAILEYTFENISNSVTDAVAAGVLCNPWNAPGHFNTIDSNNRLTVSSSEGNEITLSLLEAPENCSGQEYLYRGRWQDDLDMYLHELKSCKPFAPRTYSQSEAVRGFDHGLLAAHFTLKPGEKKRITFILTWHMAELCRNNWSEISNSRARENNIPTEWKNYYSVLWHDSKESADELISCFDEFRRKTFLFRDLLHNSDLPPAAVDGAASSLAALKSPTCLRLEDGTFYGWEGVGNHWGSCEGSCLHVWNYAQAAAFLFPDLERSMLESHLKYSVDEYGGAHFRLQLPLGLKADPAMFRPCADGQFGMIMRFFREWKISGDTNWLKKYYPVVKHVMQYAWSSKNKDLWDPEKTGLLSGRQHHTLDMELFGPNGWLQGFYLGALAAMEKIAEAAGDTGFSTECHDILERGRAETAQLFNGTYFIQKIDLNDSSILDSWDDARQNYWNEESGEIKYQIGDGLEIDSCLGEFFASLWGIGSIFDRRMTSSTLNAIYKNNFKCAYDLENAWRYFAVNDEKGVCICSWSKNKPVIPLPYYSEMMNGFEWAFASHLMLTGEYDRAVEIAAAIRDRYDGSKRNPWNEFECGSNYARSMAAYGMIPAASGFRFDMTAGMIGFFPKNKNMKRCFWSLGSVWGEFRRTGSGIEIFIAEGNFRLKKLLSDISASEIKLNGNAVCFSQENSCISLDIVLGSGDILLVK